MAKYIFLTDFLETSGLAQQLQSEGEEVLACILNSDYKHINKGIIEQIEEWHETLGQGNIYILDGCDHGKLVEWLREQGELVVGGTTETDDFENDRKKGLEIFKKYGIPYPKAKFYSSFDDAINDLKKKPTALVFKQMGNASKGFSYVGKFEDGVDMIDRLEYYKNVWHEPTDGPVSFLLQEKVSGHEIAVGAFFNGNDWIRDADGHIVVEANMEGKKLLVGDMGSTTGETTTMMFSTNEENKLFQETLAKLEPYLKEVEYKGDVDINCIVTKEGEVYALEPTMRWGIPALDMQIGAQRSPWGELLRAIAEGRQPEGGLIYVEGWTCVIVLYAPPFPYETHKQENQAAGQRIYFLKQGEWQGEDYLTDTMLKDLHFYEIEVDDEGIYRLTGQTGYVMTVTASGSDHNEAADTCIQYIKDYLTFSEMSYRLDAGSRLDGHVDDLDQLGFIGPMVGEELTGQYNGN